MDAAEHDELSLGMLGNLAGQSERIADIIRELDHLVALIVLAQNNEARAERRFRGSDAGVELFVRQAKVALGERLALADLRFLELRQDRKHRRHVNYEL